MTTDPAVIHHLDLKRKNKKKEKTALTKSLNFEDLNKRVVII